MEAKYLRYSEKEIEKIIEYYLGTPKIYKYCDWGQGTVLCLDKILGFWYNL